MGVDLRSSAPFPVIFSESMLTEVNEAKDCNYSSDQNLNTYDKSWRGRPHLFPGDAGGLLCGGLAFADSAAAAFALWKFHEAYNHDVGSAGGRWFFQRIKVRLPVTRSARFCPHPCELLWRAWRGV